MRTSGLVSRMKWLHPASKTIPPALTIPPMPTTHRRLAVHLTPLGLVVSPRETASASAGSYRGSAVLVPWGRDVQPVELSDWDEEGEVTVEAEGIAGILTGFQGRSTSARRDSSGACER